MIQAKTLQIGDTHYKVSQLGGVSASLAFVRLAKLVATMGRGDMDAKLANLFGALKEEDVTHFCQLFSAQTEIRSASGKPVRLSDDGVFDMHFAGDKLGEMLQWLKFCIMINFGSAFRGLVSAVAREPEKVAANGSPSSPRSDSTGSSIES